jgi:hydroxymethylpyrimidine pyrophosphatase-like HAD family hydrolase
MFAPPVLPDFLLVHEREIHSRIGGGWTAHAEWNNSCRERHAQLYGMAGEVFAAIEQMAGESGNTITLLYEEHGLAGLVTRTEEVMACVAENVGQMASRLPDFSFQRNTVYMRFCHRDYHKGSVLRELCDLVNIHRDEVLAAGDHFNDLSMLDGENAAMTACPANAIDPVKEIVRRAGGHVAEKSWADGIAEALCYYESPRSRRDQACA